MRRRIRWGWLAVLSAAAAFGVAVWWFGYETVERTLPVVSVAGAISTLFFLWAQRGIRPSVWSITAAASAAFFYSWVLFWFDARWYIKVPLLIGGGVLMSIANAAVRADARRAQRRRDQVAAQIVQTVNERDAGVPKFALFLRPFQSTDHLPAQPLPPSLGGGGESFPTHLDVESLLARALRKECPLIALGREGEMQEGAGRATVSEHDWQDVIARLAHHAAFLVIVPSAHRGTLWELARLVRLELLGKTLFLMPEQLREAPSGVWYTTEDDRLFDAGVRQYSASEHQYDFAAEWAAASASAQPLGIHLPPYAPAGALFVMDPQTSRMTRSAPLALSVLARRAPYLRAAVHHLGLLPSEDPRGADILDAFESAVAHRGRTLEYALVVAAHAHLAWGDVQTATDLLRRAARAGGRRPRISLEYVDWMEHRANELLAGGDAATATPTWRSSRSWSRARSTPSR